MSSDVATFERARVLFGQDAAPRAAHRKRQRIERKQCRVTRLRELLCAHVSDER